MTTSELPLNFNKICRLCLNEELKVFEIFKDGPENLPLPLQILTCVSVEAVATDSLPSLICSACYQQLDNWFKFKELSQSADSLLKQMVNGYRISYDEISKVQQLGKTINSKFSAPLVPSVAQSVLEPPDSPPKNSQNNLRTFENKQIWNQEQQSIAEYDEESTQVNPQAEKNGLDIDDDYSSDDSMSLLAHKEKLLKEKKSRSSVIKKIARVSKKEDGENIRMESTERDAEEDQKKRRNKRTQTQGAKKRFRIRPAVPSACTLCDKVYKNAEILRQHMKSHHVTGTIECQQCQMKFTSLRSLKYHEQRNHSNLEPVPCSFCGKKFLDKKYLRVHENIHSQATQYVCQFCGRKFIMKTNLTVHISRHHTQKTNDFICQVCGKAFPFKLYLKKHFKTHTDYKPHSCSHCEARFRESTLLRKHINSIHLKLRPFLCYYCQKTFTRSLYLREHMESQHLGIPKKVECLRCGENFDNRSKLRQHECTGPVEVQ